MLSLRDLQIKFGQALNTGTKLEVIIESGNLTSHERVQIYQNNITACLSKSLQITYPGIEKLVGEQFFALLCQHYIKAHPSTSGDLNNYGQAFAEFLAGFAPAQQLVYLSDMARLEWAYQRALYAEEHPPFDMATLASLKPEHYSNIIVTLNSACSLLSSPYPLKKIWDLCQPSAQTEQEINLTEKGNAIMVYRKDFAVVVEEITETEYSFLTTIAAGKTLASACEQALQSDSPFDFSACLQKQFATNNIIALCVVSQAQ